MKGQIGHADLFSLINIGRPLHQMQDARQHLGRKHPPLRIVISEAGDRARLIVIVPVETSPSASLQPCLPFIENPPNIRQFRRRLRPLPDHRLGIRRSVRMLELKDHVQLCSLLVCILFGF